MVDDEESRRVARATMPVRVLRMSDGDELTDMAGTTAEQRLTMVWEMTKNTWAFMGKPVDESTFPRHVVTVQRRGR